MSLFSIDAFTNELLNVLFYAMANVAIYNARYSIQSGNWSGARDTVWELEGSTLYSLGSGGEHVMQVTH